MTDRNERLFNLFFMLIFMLFAVWVCSVINVYVGMVAVMIFMVVAFLLIKREYEG